MTDVEAQLRSDVALACRILAVAGLVKEITGHVSARIPGSDEMVMRCRGEDEYGLRWTSEQQIRRLDFSGGGPGPGGEHVAPIELPIHGEAYRLHPGVGAVVHAHPPAALLCGLAGLELRPVFGAFDPEALELAAGGVPVFPRAVLIDRTEFAKELFSAMGKAPACLMRGHGITVVGRTVMEATVRAIKLETLAKVTWQLASGGFRVDDLPADEIESFARRSSGGSVIPRGIEWLWRHYARLAEEGSKPGEPSSTGSALW
jgi:ribulose-5-phosphate 4-epimerase/fuculose-1-phosphate aldolase